MGKRQDQVPEDVKGKFERQRRYILELFPDVPAQVDVQRGPQYFSIAQLISEFNRGEWTWHVKKGN